jgi:hypothetical protein
MKLYLLPLWLSIALPAVASSSDICSIDEIDTAAGAVKYQICFPSKFDLLNICDASRLPSNDDFLNPAGGL